MDVPDSKGNNYKVWNKTIETLHYNISDCHTADIAKSLEEKEGRLSSLYN